METFSALLVLSVRNSPVTGEFPSQRPLTRSYGVFFDLHLDKRLSWQSRRWWFDTPSRSLYDVTSRCQIPKGVTCACHPARSSLWILCHTHTKCPISALIWQEKELPWTGVYLKSLETRQIEMQVILHVTGKFHNILKKKCRYDCNV